MPTYEYEGVDARGDAVRGVLTASDQTAFDTLMSGEGVDVLHVRVVPEGYAPFVERRGLARRSWGRGTQLPPWLFPLACVVLLAVCALVWLPRSTKELVRDYRVSLEKTLSRYATLAQAIPTDCPATGLERSTVVPGGATVGSLIGPKGELTKLGRVDLVDERTLKDPLKVSVLHGMSLHQGVSKLLHTPPEHLPDTGQVQSLFDAFLALEWVAVVRTAPRALGELGINNVSAYRADASVPRPDTSCLHLFQIATGRYVGAQPLDSDAIELMWQEGRLGALSLRPNRHLLEGVGLP